MNHPPGRTVVLSLVALTVLGAALTALGTPAWWLGGALLFGSLTLARHAYGSGTARALQWLQQPVHTRLGVLVPRRVLLEGLYQLALCALAVLMMADVFSGERPVSHDHTVHYFKAWQLKTHLLPEARFYTWSHRFFAGYPANYLYPIGTDLWVNLFYAAGLGLLSFSRAYGLSFVAFHALLGWSGYRFGRAMGGPHVGFVTGLLLLTDMSEFRLGGWAYTVEYGVWPQALALAFCLLAQSQLPAIMEGRTARPIALFGLFMGLSILTHPMVLLFLVMACCVAAVAASLAGGQTVVRGLFRLAAGCALAGLIACAWLIPFLSTRAYTGAMGVFWDTTYEMGRGLLSLTALRGTLGYVLSLGLLAVFIAFRSRDFRLLYVALGATFLPLVNSSTFIDELHLPELSTAFSKVQYLRMATMVKPFWFTLAGLFVVAFARRLPGLTAALTGNEPSAAGDTSPFRKAGRAILFAMLTLPFAVSALQAFAADNVFKSLRTVNDREYLKDRKELAAYLRSHLPDDGFYRVGIFMGHNHDLFDLATEFDKPIYKRGFTPCTNFICKMESEDYPVLDAVRLRFAISKRPLTPVHYERVARFGIYGLYRFKDFKPEPYDIIEGSGRVHLEAFSDERIAFRVEDGAHGKLQLPVSYFPRWHAYRDGKPVPIGRRSLMAEPKATAFMTLPLSPGRYEVRFEPALGDLLALPLGLFGVLLALGMVAWEAWPRRAARGQSAVGAALLRLGSDRFARARLFGLLFIACACAVVFLVLAQWRPALSPDSRRIRPVGTVRYDFVEHLAAANAWIHYPGRARRCRTLGDQLVCPNDEGVLESGRYVASQPTTIEEYRMVRCIRARPEPKGKLSIAFKDVPRGQRLLGYYGIDFESRMLLRNRPVDFSVRIDGDRVYRSETKGDDHMHWFEIAVPPADHAAQVRFDVWARRAQRRWFCFYAQMVDP